jgi:hypothetical protein
MIYMPYVTEKECQATKHSLPEKQQIAITNFTTKTKPGNT